MDLQREVLDCALSAPVDKTHPRKPTLACSISRQFAVLSTTSPRGWRELRQPVQSL